MARKLEGNERKSRFVSWHNTKISENRKNDSSGMDCQVESSPSFPGWIPEAGQARQRGDSANTEPKAES